MDKVADIEVHNPITQQSVKLSSFWANGVCLLLFIRRFGCSLCRHQAKQFSVLAPQLQSKNVRMVAIGSEQLGFDEFEQGKYWPGDLYYDPEKKAFDGLGLGKKGFFGMVGTMLKPSMWSKLGDAKTAGVPGDVKGDPYQLGGCFVVSQAGEMLFEFRQADYTDDVDMDAVAKVLGVEFNKELLSEQPEQCSKDECAPPEA